MTVPVELVLDDGTALRGKFIITASRSLLDVLNGSGAFLEFEPYGGERFLIAKSSIRSLKAVNAPTASNLNARAREIDAFDPYLVLGVQRGAPFEDVRHAYVALAKVYHPDRYSGIDLPGEVKAYMATMSQRLNLAYAALEKPAQAKKAAAQRPAPVFTSTPRI